MLTVYSDKHKLRDAETELYGGKLVPPFECPVRAENILERIGEVGLGDVIGPRDFGLDPILRVHDEAFVKFLETCWAEWQAEGFEGEAIATSWPSRRLWQERVPDNIDGKIGYYAMAAETSISDGTWEASRAAADVALTAQAEVAGGAQAAFALCRPPGHHAASDVFGGYCFLNNAAIAAQAFIDQGATRVAVLDVDFHHGNGTQAVFYDRPDVLFLSLHGDPREAFPYFLGNADEVGAAGGKTYNANYPMMPGADYGQWGVALEAACKRIDDYGPDALVVSLGVDTFKDDPISFFKLESDDYRTYGERLARLRCPTLFVMEGGYAIEEVGINAVNVLEGFENG
jgi:acetoin utilization deacetylase AcuC-like enzyme